MSGIKRKYMDGALVRKNFELKQTKKKKLKKLKGSLASYVTNNLITSET